MAARNPIVIPRESAPQNRVTPAFRSSCPKRARLWPSRLSSGRPRSRQRETRRSSRRRPGSRLADRDTSDRKRPPSFVVAPSIALRGQGDRKNQLFGVSHGQEPQKHPVHQGKDGGLAPIRARASDRDGREAGVLDEKPQRVPEILDDAPHGTPLDHSAFKVVAGPLCGSPAGHEGGRARDGRDERRCRDEGRNIAGGDAVKQGTQAPGGRPGAAAPTKTPAPASRSACPMTSSKIAAAVLPGLAGRRSASAVPPGKTSTRTARPRRAATPGRPETRSGRSSCAAPSSPGACARAG